MSLFRNFWIKKRLNQWLYHLKLVLRVYWQVKVHKFLKIPHKMATVQSPKKVPNHSPEHYPPKDKILRRVIWHSFLEIWAKVKKLSGIKPPIIELTYRRVCIFRRFFGMFGTVAILCGILRNLWTLTSRWSLGTNSGVWSHWFRLFYDPNVTQWTHFCCVLYDTKTLKITLKICLWWI